MSGSRPANRELTAAWSSARTLTQKLPLASMAGQLFDDLPGQNITRGGSSETEPNEPMARPTGSPSELAVTTVTPVG